MAVGPQYCLIFALHELGTHSHLSVDTLPVHEGTSKDP